MNTPRQQEMLEIARTLSGRTGTAFLLSLVEHLARFLSADFALVARLLPDGKRVQTEAAVCDGEIVPQFEYDLIGTPCADVATNRMCFLNSGVQEMYPDDRMLCDLGVQAYGGAPLRSSQGDVIGLMVVLFRKPLLESVQAEVVFDMFASREASELERIHAGDQLARNRSALEARSRELEAANARLELAAAAADMTLWDLDVASGLVTATESALHTRRFAASGHGPR